MKRNSVPAAVIVKQLIKQQEKESDDTLAWLRCATCHLNELVQRSNYDEIAEDAADYVGTINEAHEAFVLSEIKLNKLEHTFAALSKKTKRAKYGRK